MSVCAPVWHIGRGSSGQRILVCAYASQMPEVEAAGSKLGLAVALVVAI
jgi:hypothetical protein